MRRLFRALLTVGVAFLALGGPRALAHPMGTLSTNRSAQLRLGADGAWVDYTVDFAEVPSVAELGRIAELGPDAWATARMAEMLPQVHLTLDGSPVSLVSEGCFASTTAGDGALEVVGLFCRLRAPTAMTAGLLALRDDNFAGSVGWREIRVLADGIEVSAPTTPAAVGAGERMPLPFTSAPEEMTLASVSVVLGQAGSVGPLQAGAVVRRAPDAFAALVGGDLSPRFVILALLSALVLGAGHALSPGHGKTVVAAYLVGSRGTVGQALLLGLTVTATHVSSVLLIGLVTLFLSEWVIAEQLFPWIGVASGLGVVAVGTGLLRSRWRRWSGAKDDGWLDHDHGPEGHSHVVRNDRGEPVGLRDLLVLGVTGGAVPCPSALVVLLAAVALHRILFGLLLIVSFSLGLAAVLMGIGILVVRAGGLLDRFSGANNRFSAWVPVASAAIVMALGLGIAVQSALEGGLI